MMCDTSHNTTINNDTIIATSAVSIVKHSPVLQCSLAVARCSTAAVLTAEVHNVELHAHLTLLPTCTRCLIYTYVLPIISTPCIE